MSLNPRKLLTGAAVGVAALSLIGAGAGASFMDQVTVTQDVSTGTLDLSIGEQGKSSLALEPIANQDSTVDEMRTFTLFNDGSLDAPVTFAVTNVGSEALAKALNVTVTVGGAKPFTMTAYDLAQAGPQAFGQLKAKDTVPVTLRIKNTGASLANDLQGTTLSSTVTLKTEA